MSLVLNGHGVRSRIPFFSDKETNPTSVAVSIILYHSLFASNMLSSRSHKAIEQAGNRQMYQMSRWQHLVPPHDSMQAQIAQNGQF